MTREQQARIDRAEARVQALGCPTLTAIVHEHIRDQLRQRGYGPGLEVQLIDLVQLGLPGRGGSS